MTSMGNSRQKHPDQGGLLTALDSPRYYVHTVVHALTTYKIILFNIKHFREIIFTMLMHLNFFIISKLFEKISVIIIISREWTPNSFTGLTNSDDDTWDGRDSDRQNLTVQGIWVSFQPAIWEITITLTPDMFHKFISTLTFQMLVLVCES